MARKSPGRHVARRMPRAHWVLLLLWVVVVAVALALHGYATVGLGTGTAAQPGRGSPAPRQVREAGPVIRPEAGGVATLRAPARTVALTFDDGPDPVWTPRILDALRRHGAKATFFVVGSRVTANPELARRIVAEGHEIGIHTYSHLDVGASPRWRTALELSLTQHALAAATGRHSRLFRPPYSSFPDALDTATWNVTRDLADDGYLLVLSDLDTEDWRRPGAARIAANGMPAAGKGAVVLMHDGGGDRSQTVAALDVLLPRLKRDGYRLTTVSQAMAIPKQDIAAGTAARIRAHALHAALAGTAGLVDAMVWLVVAAGILTGLRSLAQVGGAAWHRRRERRRRRRRRHREVLDPVSIIVPAYNESANIAEVVRSLAASRYPYVEVVVVDDGSSDGTADIVERLGLPGVVVVRQANAGKPAALNTGAAYASHDLLIMVDGDTVFEPDTVYRLVQPFADPAVGAVSGNTKIANRRGLLGRWQHVEYVIGFNLDRRLFDVARCMPTVPGAIGAFRRDALASVGGVSGETLAEDTDLTMALCRRGWRVVYKESARAWTEAPATLRQLWRQRYRWSYGTLQAMWKHRRALVQGGASGRLGRRGLGYLLVFQFALPLLAPLVDLFALYGLVFGNAVGVTAVWLGFLAVQAATAAYAFRLDSERLGPLWTMPLQLLVYRQFMYLVVVQSTVTAVLGAPLRWHRMHRGGHAAALRQDATRERALSA